MDPYDELLDFAAENNLSPREAWKVLTSAHPDVLPGAPSGWFGMASASSPRHAIPASGPNFDL